VSIRKVVGQKKRYAGGKASQKKSTYKLWARQCVGELEKKERSQRCKEPPLERDNLRIAARCERSDPYWGEEKPQGVLDSKGGGLKRSGVKKKKGCSFTLNSCRGEGGGSGQVKVERDMM